MASSRTKLTQLQIDLLRGFFEQEKGFFLTGGAALAGFYLHHRATEDLDLFTSDGDAFERGPHALAEAVERLGASMVVRQQAPGFHRYVVSRNDEAVVVDLVLDRVPQLHVKKWQRGGIAIDPPQEILVNKLNTVASRCETRDLVDLYLLEESGLRVEDALEAALRKDGGCTPATLAWVLSQVHIPEGAALPAGIESNQLTEYLNELARRLRRAAAPS